MVPRSVLILMVALAAAGCSQHTATTTVSSGAMPAATAPASAPAASGSVEPAIAWYSGTVESAFAAARAQNKPVFLYWGAQWCPPCHELKATVFSRSEFIEKLKLFIPVYLDGDDAGAQKWGEKFGVSGYPTVLVLRADQDELARISGGMDLAQYSEVLDTVLGDVRPVNTILAGLKAGGARPLSRDDCHRLAYYGWDLTDEVGSRSAALSQTLAQAAARCPIDTDRDKARLTLMAASMAASAEAAALSAGKPPADRLIRLVGQVDTIMRNTPLATDTVDAVGGLGESFFLAVAQVAPKQSQDWNQRYASLMDAASADPRFSSADHLYFLYAKIQATKALNLQHTIPPELSAQAHQRIDTALAGKLDEHSRASVVNAALNVLDLIGDDDRAYAITREQMAQSKSPYYYMLDLADLDEKHGHIDSAVDWLSKAYQQSQGAATRFQWGTDYVLGLIRMKPQDDAAIRSAGLSVLGELDGPDRIYRRTRMRLERLDQALVKWNAKGEHTATLSALRERMTGICSQLPKTDAGSESCRGFLAKVEAVKT